MNGFRGSLLIALIGVTLVARTASGVTVYRIGTPFSNAERDSLGNIGSDIREISWSPSQLADAVEPDSLQAGSLQPNFFDLDEDIAATVLQRDGWVGVKNFANINKLIGQVMIDQDAETAYRWTAVPFDSFNVGGPGNPRFEGEQITLDMGGRFTIREVKLRPPPQNPEHSLENLTIGVSDRGFQVTGRVINFPAIAAVVENVEPEISVVLDPPVTTEVVQLRIFRQTPKEISIAAFEIYGGGFVSAAAYVSDVIELEDIASLGELRWSGRRDPHARVDIRTRLGSDAQPEIFWETREEQQDSVKFLQGGGDLSFNDYKSAYARLSDFLKPQDPRDQVSLDIENWTFWSNPYTFENPGVDIVSPGARQFAQIRADFSSTFEDGGKIDYIEFKASVPPAVRRLVGEIFPIETEIGEATHFTYYIQPTILSGDSSFDAIEISTPSGLVSVDSLRLDQVDLDFQLQVHDDGMGFEMFLPRKLELTDSGALLEVVFNAPVLREVGNRFDCRVFDTSLPHEVRQRVTAGNAVDEVLSDRLSVSTSLSSSLVFSPQIAPNPFTPNGDGFNEVANISYKLLRLTSAVPVAIDIFDVSGRLVRQVYAGEDAIGEYAHMWDGRDNGNNLVPPGLYLYRIAAQIQSGQETNSGIIAVVY